MRGDRRRFYYPEDDDDFVVGVRPEDSDIVNSISNQSDPSAQKIISPFTALAEGKTVGKRVNLDFSFRNSNPAPVNLLEVRGDDNNALDLVVTIPPPRALNAAGGITLPANRQQATGEMDNHAIQTALPTFIWASLFIRAQWGIGGIDSSADIDVANGAEFQVRASFLRLQAVIEDNNVSESPAIYTVGAFVGPNNGGARGQSKRTIQVGAIAASPAVSALFPIPRMANGVIPFYAGASTNCDVVFFRDPAATTEVGRFRYAAGFPIAEYAPVPDAAYYFRIDNLAAFGVNARAIFSLTL